MAGPIWCDIHQGSYQILYAGDLVTPVFDLFEHWFFALTSSFKAPFYLTITDDGDIFPVREGRDYTRFVRFVTFVIAGNWFLALTGILAG